LTGAVAKKYLRLTTCLFSDSNITLLYLDPVQTQMREGWDVIVS